MEVTRKLLERARQASEKARRRGSASGGGSGSNRGSGSGDKKMTHTDSNGDTPSAGSVTAQVSAMSISNNHRSSPSSAGSGSKSPSSSNNSMNGTVHGKRTNASSSSSSSQKQSQGRPHHTTFSTISRQSRRRIVYPPISHTYEDLLSDGIHAFREVSDVDQRRELFIRKLRLCCVVFDFTGSDKNAQRQAAKEKKRQFLLELVDYISQIKHWFTDEVMPPIIAMLSINLFRSLPPPLYADFDPDEDEPNFDPTWPHLQFVYEFFHRFVMTADVKLIRQYVKKDFLLNMIGLFNSEDPRERDYLKMILHRIYGRCMPFRAFIRKSLNNLLYPIIYSGYRHNGTSEVLEILGSIINGFALPLKDEHVRFLRNVLIPLHKVTTMSQFHQQLAYCITQFIQKDPSLASVVIGGVLKFWPATSCQKELLFLNEMEEILELTGTQQLETVIKPLFERIGMAICSNHFQVAERALFLWNNDIIATFTSDHRAVILPIIYPALQTNYARHWNSTVSSLTLNIIRIFKEMDKKLYDQVSKEYKDHRIDPDTKERVRRERWKALKALKDQIGD